MLTINDLQGAACVLSKYLKGEECEDLAVLALVQYWENISGGYRRNIKSLVSWDMLRECRNTIAHNRNTTVYEESMKITRPFLHSIAQQTIDHFIKERL